MSTRSSGDSRFCEEIEALIAECQGPLLRYATRLLNDSSAAQDVVQNTFIKLCRNWKEGAHSSPQLLAWLYRVTHNGAVDYIRAESRRNVLSLKHGAEEQSRLDCRGGDGISDEAEKAAALLQRLPIRDRQLVILKVYEEKSYGEISVITGLTVGNVGYILHHAMRKLAEMMKTAMETDKDR